MRLLKLLLPVAALLFSESSWGFKFVKGPQKESAPVSTSREYRHYKNSCKPKNHLNKLPSVTDQDSIGWCFAHAAGNLLSAHLGQLVSASALAISFHENQGAIAKFIDSLFYDESERIQRGGSLYSVVNHALKKGVCLEKDYPSDDAAISKTFRNIKASIDFIKTLRGSIASHHARQYWENPKVAEATSSVERSERAVEAACNEVCLKNLKAIFPNITRKDLASVATKSSRKNFYKHLYLQACKNPKKLKKAGLKTISNSYFGSSSAIKKFDDESSARINFIGKLQNRIAKGQLVGFRADASFLYRKNAEFNNVNHVMVLAGQRWKNGECEFLIRNSWGNSCGSYDQSYECKNGDIWVPSRTLARMTSHAFAIDN